MKKLTSLGRAAGAVGVTLGVAAAGAAVGFAAERYIAGRSLRGDDPYADEPFGTLRGAPRPVCTDDGVSLHVEIDEPDGRPDVTVVFAHGYALSMDSWHFQRRDLRGSARLVFYDHRSHGRSGRAPAGRGSVDRLVRDLAQVIGETAGPGPLVLAGHSMGAMTIMALASAQPEWFVERVDGVALVATSHRELPAASLGMRGPAGRLVDRVAPGVMAALARRPDLVERGRKAGSDLGFVLTRRYSFVGGGSPALVNFTAEMNTATPIDVVADFLPLFSVNDQSSALPVLAKVPTLIIGADGDRITPVDHSRVLAEELPTAEYVEVPDTGHMVQLERHELVTEKLRELIDRARSGRPGWWRRRRP